MAEIELGINNSFAAKNWPEPLAWARIVAEELGLSHVQFSFDLLDPTLPEPGLSVLCDEVLAAIQRYSLCLRTTFTGSIAYAQNLLAHPNAIFRSQARQWFEAALDFTGKLGAEGTGGYMGAMSVGDHLDPDRRNLVRNGMVEIVRGLTERAAASGQRYLLWELMPSPREIPHVPAEAIDLLQEVNAGAAVPVMLCFDLGHCCASDLAVPGDPHRWLEELLPWTRMVHLQQTDGAGDRHWPFTPEHDEVGIINPQRVIEIAGSSPLERVDLVFEIGHSPESEPGRIIDDHKRSVDAWGQWL
jgi:hypothetical protein